MRVLIFGSGKMAVASALDLEKDKKVERITLTGRRKRGLENAHKRTKSGKVDTVKIDVTSAQAIDLMKKYDVGIGALPHPASPLALKNAVKAGLSVADMVYEEETMTLDEDAKKAGVTIIPGLGVHPGIANVFAGHGYRELDKTLSIIVRCGGLPEHPTPPLNHKTAFNLYSALGEYVAKPRIIEDGKLKLVEPMSELERIHHPKLGDLECFLTDTATTMLKSFRDVRQLKSKTVRWPGNRDYIKFLMECGLLSKDEVEINSIKTTGIDICASILAPKITLKEGEKELTYLETEVKGYEGRTLKEHRYKLLDYYDEKEGITSMGRTTGFPAAIAARMIAKGQVELTGVIPPEKIFIEEKFEHLMKELSKRGISLKMTEKWVKETIF